MVLSAILFGLSLTAFGIIDRQFHLFDEKTQAVVQRDQFLRLLGNDVNKADLIKRNDQDLIFQFPDYELVYNFDENFIQRSHNDPQLRKDTFALESQLLEAFFEENAISFGPVDHFSFEIKVHDEWLSINKEKAYSASDYIYMQIP